jgi:drug/metabolite transporter (DMT)-like permease
MLATSQIHFCVVLWGFTAILGKLISLSALPLVWWRMLLVAIVLCAVPRFWRGVRALPPRLIGIYAGIGLLVSCHWLTFYGSIKLSNASVAATCMAVTPVFIAVVEPFIAKRKFELRELFLGVAVIPGVMLVVGGTPDNMHLGIAIGVLSAVFVAFFGSLNKRYIGESDALSVTGIEMAAGVVAITSVGLFFPNAGVFVVPDQRDTVWLLLLAMGCTLLPFALSLVALRRLSAFATALAINMEPVYTIIFAILLLGEQRELDPLFYVGVAIILCVVFLHPLMGGRK